MRNHANSTLVVAVGSSHGDDLAAWHVGDLLNSLIDSHVDIRKASVPLNMIDWLEGVTRLHIIDACEGGGEVGDLLRIGWPAEKLTRLRAAGTHDFDVASVLELADSLGRLPHSITIWAIVGNKFAPDDQPSEKLKARLPSIAHRIKQEVGRA